MKGGFPIIKYKGGTMDMEYDIGSKIKAARLKKKMKNCSQAVTESV